LFAIFVAVVVGVALAVGPTLPSDFLQGLVLGVAVTAAPTAVWVFAMQQTGTAPTMMGDLAEQWTAQELRCLRKQGWRLVNHFALRVDDIDHVLIGPGGAWAVETKWSATEWRSEAGRVRIAGAVEQALANGRSLGLWHEFKSRRVPVGAVVVLWGPGLSRWPDEDQSQLVNGVPVIAGPRLRRWLEEMAESSTVVVEAHQIDAAWAAMDRQVAQRDALDLEAHPIPTSLSEWACLSGVAVAAFALAMRAFGALLDLTDHWTIPVTGGLALGLCPIVLKRRNAPSYVLWPAWAWGSTLALLSLVYGGAVALEAL
jgi:hypothetical protein